MWERNERTLIGFDILCGIWVKFLFPASGKFIQNSPNEQHFVDLSPLVPTALRVWEIISNFSWDDSSLENISRITIWEQLTRFHVASTRVYKEQQNKMSKWNFCCCCVFYSQNKRRKSTKGSFIFHFKNNN